MDKFKENNLILFKGGSAILVKTMVVDLFEFPINNVDKFEYKLSSVESKEGSIYAIRGGAATDIINSSLYQMDTITLPHEFSLDTVSTIDIIKYLSKLYVSYGVRKRENFGNFWLKEENISYVIKLTNELCDLLPPVEQEQTYIRCLSISQDSRVIIIGDIHGSFHSVFRILLRLHRMNYLDISELKLSPNIFLIFLGDVVDRGFFSLEILLLIFLLLQKNPSNVFYNRGNHEEEEINYRDGLSEEIRLKSCKQNDLCRNAEDLFKQLNSFFKKCSSAIIINKSVYLAHGGFSKFDDYTELISFLNSDERERIVYIKDIKKISSDKQQSTGTFTRWSDFGIKCQNRGFSDDTCIKPEDLESFLNKTKLQFIIRGHQDNADNNVLFASEIFNPEHNYPMCGISLSESMDRIRQNSNSFIQYNRGLSFCRININEMARNPAKKIGDTDIYSVLTTSTNTDFQRNLKKDGFVILHWVDNPSSFVEPILRDLPEL